MGAVLLSPLYVLLNIYLFSRIQLWLTTLHSVLGSYWFTVPFLTCYILLAASPLAAAFGKGGLKTLGLTVFGCWLGILMYFLIFLLFFDLGRIILCLVHHSSPLSAIANLDQYRISGGIVCACVILLSVYGILHARHVRLRSYDVEIAKNQETDSLKIALLADLHLGNTVGIHHAEQIDRQIRRIQPDLIIFAGDIFDNDFDTIRDADRISQIFRELPSTYGSFAVWGNHDIDEVILAGFTFNSGEDAASSDPRMDQFLKNSGIQLLKDESLLIDHSFYLTGRLDASSRVKSGIIRKTAQELLAPLDHEKPLIVIDHQPSDLDALAGAGADLVLSGHTHDGQLFPGNLTTRLTWKNSYGKQSIGSMTSIVTSGVGVWGPAMRIGTSSEVVEINVSFKN